MRAWRCQWRRRWRRWLLISGGITPYCVFIFYFISRFDCSTESRFFSFSFWKLLGNDDCWLLFETHTHTHTQKEIFIWSMPASRASRNAESKAETTKPKLDFKTAVEINSNCFQFNFYFGRFTSTSMAKCSERMLSWPCVAGAAVDDVAIELRNDISRKLRVYLWMADGIHLGDYCFVLNLYFLAYFNSSYFRQIVRTLLAFNTSVFGNFSCFASTTTTEISIYHSFNAD